LTVVEKIVDDHGGSVVVESTSAQGTVFKVLLPARLFPTALEQGTAPVPRFAGSEEQE
jgi:nitrogen-specific signal transduction histidine kinase